MNLLIDFDGLASNPTNALRKVTAMLQRSGLTAIGIESDGRSKRIAGVSFREAFITFADSQKLTLRVKATGDVYEVRINDKVTPIKAQDDAGAAVKEIAALLDLNRAKFQKRMAAVRMNTPEGVKTAAPSLRKQLETQSAELDVAIADAREELASLQAA